MFLLVGVTIMFHQHHLNRVDVHHDERDIQRQIGIDKKMVIITAVGMSVVFTALYPL